MNPPETPQKTPEAPSEDLKRSLEEKPPAAEAPKKEPAEEAAAAEKMIIVEPGRQPAKPSEEISKPVAQSSASESSAIEEDDLGDTNTLRQASDLQDILNRSAKK